MMVDGKWTNVPVGDEWVASYNPYLLLRFDCHIHVDVVTATACFKYLFKYCHKTEDYARARIQGITDEIELYRKTRYISAAEATWRLLGFQMIDRNPAVTKLHVHLEGEQYVLFPSNATQAQRLEITNRTHSPLMEYFSRPIGVYNMRLKTVPVVSEPLPDTFLEIPNYTIKFVSNSCSTCLKIVATTTSA